MYVSVFTFLIAIQEIDKSFPTNKFISQTMLNVIFASCVPSRIICHYPGQMGGVQEGLRDCVRNETLLILAL